MWQLRCKANALLEINHCYEQKEYVDWKYQHLAKNGYHATEGFRRIAYRFTTLSFAIDAFIIAKRFIGGRKAIPESDADSFNFSGLVYGRWL